MKALLWIGLAFGAVSASAGFTGYSIEKTVEHYETKEMAVTKMKDAVPCIQEPYEALPCVPMPCEQVPCKKMPCDPVPCIPIVEHDTLIEHDTINNFKFKIKMK